MPKFIQLSDWAIMQIKFVEFSGCRGDRPTDPMLFNHFISIFFGLFFKMRVSKVHNVQFATLQIISNTNDPTNEGTIIRGTKRKNWPTSSHLFGQDEALVMCAYKLAAYGKDH